MEYYRNICITQQDFHELLMSNHDCDMYLKISLFFGGVFLLSLAVTTNMLVERQREIGGLIAVKASLMEHIVALEDDLASKYTEEGEEGVEGDDEAEAETEDLDDLHVD